LENREAFDLFDQFGDAKKNAFEVLEFYPNRFFAKPPNIHFVREVLAVQENNRAE